MLLALVLVLGCTSALAVEEIDYSKYSQFPLVTDGSVTIRVVTHRNDAVGTAIENIWFWPWLEKITGINFEVEQILDSVRGEKFSLMLASDDLPDLIYGMNMTTAELVRYGQSEGLLMPLNEFLTEDIMPNACAWFEAYRNKFFTMDDTKNNAYMSDGTLGVYPSVPFIVNADKEFWDDWCSCTPLTSEYNDKQQWVPADSIGVGNWAVSASSEHGELLARLCDFFSDIGALLAWFGPMTGTSDCLDMTEGWSFDEETNEVVLGDVVSGKYPSTNEYSHQVGCAVNGGGVGAYSHSLGLSDIPADLDVGNILRYLAGMPIKEAGFNLEQPDPAFRHSMSLHISPYYVSGFPSVVYYDEDTTYAMSDLRAVLNTYVKAEVAKFIVGERSLDEFDTFVSELEGMGLRELEGYYQAAYDSYMAGMA